MSKSKLNKRQLKKISKLALQRVEKYWGIKCDIDDFFRDCCGDWYISIRDYWGEYDETPVMFELDKCFCNEWDLLYGIDADYCNHYENMSFANKVHYMIKFLEISDE